MIPPATVCFRSALVAAFAAVLALGATGCKTAHGDDGDRHAGSYHGDVSEHARMFDKLHHAVAVLIPTEGNDVHGEIWFTQRDGTVHIKGEVRGLKPNSKHGFHVHEYGDLTADDGTSAGGHYNPEGHDHALPNGQPRHAGDLGNITADSRGVGKIDITVDNLTVAGLENPVIGRGLIVHADPDDGGQPTGNAGPRIGMGVIGVAKPKQ